MIRPEDAKAHTGNMTMRDRHLEEIDRMLSVLRNRKLDLPPGLQRFTVCRRIDRLLEQRHQLTVRGISVKVTNHPDTGDPDSGGVDDA